ncbi:MAG TPA: shikimate kinase [Cytophagaceae bacterium]|nr:shikimate kinase [Cytophagaceae bacterium]
MKLFLIGLPGSGKSTLGKDLSEKLNYPLIDTDDVICKKEGCSIEEIFANKGEDYFRKIESNILKEVIQTNNAIISTGGGTPCFFDNMEVINQNGLSVFLNIPLKDITKRLLESVEKNRPLIQGKNPEQVQKFLMEKLKERISFYNQANIEFTDSLVTADMIIEEILRRGLL